MQEKIHSTKKIFILEKKDIQLPDMKSLILIEQLTETENGRKATLKLWLKQREKFWTLKQDTLHFIGLNEKLDIVYNWTVASAVLFLIFYCILEETYSRIRFY